MEKDWSPVNLPDVEGEPACVEERGAGDSLSTDSGGSSGTDDELRVVTVVPPSILNPGRPLSVQPSAGGRPPSHVSPRPSPSTSVPLRSANNETRSVLPPRMSDPGATRGLPAASGGLRGSCPPQHEYSCAQPAPDAGVNRSSSQLTNGTPSLPRLTPPPIPPRSADMVLPLSPQSDTRALACQTPMGSEPPEADNEPAPAYDNVRSPPPPYTPKEEYRRMQQRVSPMAEQPLHVDFAGYRRETHEYRSHPVAPVEQSLSQLPALTGPFVEPPRYIITTNATLINPSLLGPRPMAATCPNCFRAVITEVTATAGTLAYLLCVMLSVFGLFCGCCLIPFCLEDCQDSEHRCPNCKAFLGVYRRI